MVSIGAGRRASDMMRAMTRRLKNKQVWEEPPQDEADGDTGENVISKSQRKRDSDALQKVGEELVGLSPDTLKKFDLDENLLRAILEAKKIQKSKFGAQKRQMQYIGRLMRDVDAAPIIARLTEMKVPGKQANALHHLAERWRERLMSDESALGAFLNDFPDADREALARDIAEAKVEQAKGKPPKHFRLLYQSIHKLIVKGS
jgi:ribosome-associated protein